MYSLRQSSHPAPPSASLRRRQQALGNATELSRMGSFSAIYHLAQSEGVAGMYKGLILNLIKNPIATAVSFAVNDLIRERLSSPRSDKRK